MIAPHPQFLDYGVAGRGLPGAAVSGDLHWVRQEAERFYIAVIDGLGHGPDAAAAASAAAAALEASTARSVARLMMDCHAALVSTRGAVIGLAEFDARRDAVTWISVGNIEGRLLRASANGGRAGSSLLMQGGIVGHRLPRLHATAIRLQTDDLLALATDGIAAEFDLELLLDLPPQQAANRVLARCAKPSDDALIFVVRWIGSHGRRE